MDVFIDPSQLSILLDTLKRAVEESFMSREHAALIWKRVIKESGYDVEKKGGKNGFTQES